MLSVANALEELLKSFSVLPSESVSVAKSYGRILSDDILAPFDLPLFSNSSMDGFAVLAGDLKSATKEHPVELIVTADIPAGTDQSLTLRNGQAMRIMTGAPIPLGSDAVIPVEDTNFNHRQPGVKLPPTVLAFKIVKPGENIRPKGQDVHKGELVLYAGHILRSQDVGFLSMMGISKVSVYRKPRVALLSTGDELLSVGLRLKPGKIYDANSSILTSLIVENGGEVIDLGIAPDQDEIIRSRLDNAISRQADLILSSAGVSVGAFDFVRKVVEENGVLAFWKVNMRPGKPLAFGKYRSVPFAGLPGNPVSAYVGFEVFVRPAISKMRGLQNWQRPTELVILAEEIESDGRESYLRAIVYQSDAGLLAKLTGHQGSGNLRSLVQSNAFLIVPSEVKSLPIGTEVKAWITGEIREEKDTQIPI